MFAILTAVALLAPPQKPPQAPVPPRAVNREQPKDWKPYVRPGNFDQTKAMNYHRDNGNRFKGGYWYNGYAHPHWSYHYWDRRYATFLYYDPGTLVYFYWKPDKPPPAPPPYEGK